MDYLSKRTLIAWTESASTNHYLHECNILKKIKCSCSVLQMQAMNVIDPCKQRNGSCQTKKNANEKRSSDYHPIREPNLNFTTACAEAASVFLYFPRAHGAVLNRWSVTYLRGTLDPQLQRPITSHVNHLSNPDHLRGFALFQVSCSRTVSLSITQPLGVDD